MDTTVKRYALCLLMLLPLHCFAATVNGNNFYSFAKVISIANVVLEVSSVICIKQFFFLGDSNKTNFQRFNLIFSIVFYFVALSFLVSEKNFYVGFEQLSTIGCIRQFFFGGGIYSCLQWLVIFAMVINVLYIKRYHDA